MPRSETYNVRVGFRVSAHMHELLSNEAGDLGLTQTDNIRRIIADHYAEHPEIAKKYSDNNGSENK